MRQKLLTLCLSSALLAGSALAASAQAPPNQAPGKRPNVVILMTDDTGWNDFGAYSGGGAALGHPTPNIDRIGREGAVFTNWYGQASCTAGRASFITGRIPIRSALSIVVAPGDENCAAQGDADDCRVLQEERLLDLLLGQVASRRQAGILSDRARLRRDEGTSPPTIPASIPTAIRRSGSTRGSPPTTRNSRGPTSTS